MDSTALRARAFDRATGEPLAGVSVATRLVMSGQEDLPVGSATTSQDGRFELTCLPAGAVRVSVRPGRDSGTGTPALAYSEQDVTLARGDSTSVEFAVPRLRGDGALQGTVALSVLATDARTGAPIEKARATALGFVNLLTVAVGPIETGEDGRGSGALVAAARYRVGVARWQPGLPVYR
jgi:5-hydroxyisourate hydrolase-like protein (transthyretin family)